MTRAQFETRIDDVPTAASLAAHLAGNVSTTPYVAEPFAVLMTIYDAWNEDPERHAL